MKGTIEFDLPMEQEEFQTAVDGMKRKIVLSNLDNWLRGLNKYENLETVDVMKAREKIQELLDEWDLRIMNIQVCTACYHEERRVLAEEAQRRGDWLACTEFLEEIWHDCEDGDCEHDCTVERGEE